MFRRQQKPETWSAAHISQTLYESEVKSVGKLNKYIYF